MVERASVTQAINVGVEAVAGTTPAAAAFKRLQSLSLTPGVKADVELFRPVGTKYPTVQALNREWTESGVVGEPSYGEIVYPLSSIIGTGTVAQVMDGATPTGGYNWDFTPNTSADDTPKSYTIEQGSAATRIHRYNYGLFSEFGVEVSRANAGVTGKMYGQVLADNIGAFTQANPATVELVPMLPAQWSVYMDATSAALGTTKQTRVLNAKWGIANKSHGMWVVDAANPSWVAPVEDVPAVTVELLMEADAQGMDPLTRLRSGATRFLRLEALGPTIYTGGITVQYRFRLDLAGVVSNPDDFSDEDGVYAVKWTFTAVHDATWGKAFTVNVRNKVSAL